MRPLCFVLMPFGTKKDASEKEINFDVVYRSFIKPAILKAGLDPIRADEEQAGGFIHKPMYERLMFCNFSIADLSFANANVFYELGIRHALKPHTTISIFETGTKLPFDTAPLRSFNYDYKDNTVLKVDQKIDALAALLLSNIHSANKQEDSPIAQLISGYKFPDLDYLQSDADAFKEWAASHGRLKKNLGSLSKQWKQLKLEKERTEVPDLKLSLEAELKNVIGEVKNLQHNVGEGLQYCYEIICALLNTYKTMNAFQEIALMLRPLVETTLAENIYIRQQLALACNKIKEREESAAILKAIIQQYGPDPETNGLLGATYKGLMEDSKGDFGEAGYREKAIRSYLEGFDADPREYYPGINALCLMYSGNTKQDLFEKYLPLVQFAVDRQLSKKADDYWVHATRLELAVLSDRSADAFESMADLLTCNPEEWAKESTKSNIEKLYQRKTAVAEEHSMKWLKTILERL